MSLDKHRVPGSIDKHLPNFRGESVRTESAVIGGRSFTPFTDTITEEVFNESGGSFTTSFSAYDAVLVDFHVRRSGTTQAAYLQVNGDSGTNYSQYTHKAANATGREGVQLTGGSEAESLFGQCHFVTDGGSLGFALEIAPSVTSSSELGFRPTIGFNNQITNPISSITVVDNGGNKISGELLVTGRQFTEA